MSVPAVFFKLSDVAGDMVPPLIDICRAAEKSLTENRRVVGAQIIRQLVRIYPESKEARAELLVKGLSLSGQKIIILPTNPFIVNNPGNKEMAKLVISDIPISFANSEIGMALKKEGFQFDGKVENERIRDEKNNLTAWLSGRRYVWIEKPKRSHDRKIKIGQFIGTIWYRGMPSIKKCYICKSDSHLARDCDVRQEQSRHASTISKAEDENTRTAMEEAASQKETSVTDVAELEEIGRRASEENKIQAEKNVACQGGIGDEGGATDDETKRNDDTGDWTTVANKKKTQKRRVRTENQASSGEDSESDTEGTEDDRKQSNINGSKSPTRGRPQTRQISITTMISRVRSQSLKRKELSSPEEGQTSKRKQKD